MAAKLLEKTHSTATLHRFSCCFESLNNDFLHIQKQVRYSSDRFPKNKCETFDRHVHLWERLNTHVFFCRDYQVGQSFEII